MPAYPAVIPMIAYEDGPGAMAWLATAFGFKERMRMVTKEGRLSHGEMEAGEGPNKHREGCEQARKWSAVPYIVDGVLVYVSDVKAHYEQARRAGARILSDIDSDEKARRYRVEDLEGHRWMFMERE